MRKRLFGVPILALALVLTSCGGTETGNGTAAPPADGDGIGAADPETLRDGGTFRWPLNSLPPTFNYLHVNGTEAVNAWVIGALMPSLKHATGDGTVRDNEDYLVSSELTSEDPQTVTYTLREEATWSDGNPITWEDLHAQWQALNGENEEFQISSSTGYSQIASVERGESDKQAVVTFENPYTDWEALFGTLYPAVSNTDPEMFNSGWTENLPVTAGPFTVDQIDRTANTITLVRDENWWGTPPRLERIIFRAIPVEAQFDAFANNEIDMVDIGPDISSFTRAQTTPGAEVRQSLAPNLRHITFNGNEGAILADRDLRIAIQKGINRQAIAEAQIGQIVPDVTPLGNHIYVEGQRGYQDNSQLVAYDPAEASRMLDELGWTREGDGIRTKDGQELVIRDVIPTQVPTSEREARQVQQFLREIGVRVDIVTVPTAGFFDEQIKPGNFDITHFSWLGTPFPVSSKGSIYELRGDIQQNYGGIGNQTINDLFAEAIAELDPDRRIELANQIDQEIWATGHSLLLYQRPDVVAVRSGVANFGAFGFADPVYTDIGFTE